MAHDNRDGGAMAGARFVDPRILARIGNLELLARTVVDGFINGLHRAPFFGASIDFAEHRGYVAGDDIRRVDWRLYARTDRYYVKADEAGTTTMSARWNQRGVGYWTDGTEERVYWGTGDGYLVAVDAKTGKQRPDIGGNG